MLPVHNRNTIFTYEMPPMDTGGSSGGINSRYKSYSKNNDQQFDIMPSGKERCADSQLPSTQITSFVPNSTAVPAMSFQPGNNFSTGFTFINNHITIEQLVIYFFNIFTVILYKETLKL
jgi:hypothetical protein